MYGLNSSLNYFISKLSWIVIFKLELLSHLIFSLIKDSICFFAFFFICYYFECLRLMKEKQKRTFRGTELDDQLPQQCLRTGPDQSTHKHSFRFRDKMP